MLNSRVIVDENSGTATKLWAEFQRELGDRYSDFLWLSESHPGIPDVEILDKLLGPETVLLTGDCVLHQRAIEAGFRSYTLNEQGQLTRHRLPNVNIRKPLPVSVHKQLEHNYQHQQENIELAKRLNSQLSERDSKRLRTARRRIRSHFGSAAAIARVSLTIGSIPTRRGLLAGCVFRFSGNSGVKGLRGGETYCLCSSGEMDTIGPFVIALRHPLYDRAKQCMHAYDYEQAVLILQQIPAPFRPAKVDRLLDKAIDAADEVNLLIAEIDDAVRRDELQGLQPIVEQLLTLKPGHRRTVRNRIVASAPVENSIGMKSVRIEPGEFLMGSPESELYRGNDEHQHRVKISKPFYLGQFEVTVGQFRRFVTEMNFETLVSEPV